MATAKKLPSGNWNVIVYDGKKDGKRIYKSFTADTKKEAEYAASEYSMFKKEKNNPDNITVAEALENYILINKNILSPSTIQGYEKIKDNNLKDLLSIKLKDLTETHVQSSLNIAAINLSAKTLKNIYGFLLSALRRYKIKMDLSYPKSKKVINELPTPSEIIKAVKGTSIELPVLLAIWLSLRMSEVRGLKYKDIRDNFIIVQRTILDIKGIPTERDFTKTKESTRKIRLPDYIKSLMPEGKPDDYIVTLTANTITKRFYKILSDNHIPHIRFHDLRHINASVMLALNVPNKYAMERGGWSDDRILKSVYQHTYSAERNDVDNRIDNYFLSTMQNEMQNEKA